MLKVIAILIAPSQIVINFLFAARIARKNMLVFAQLQLMS
jgi:hypothetical protein